jgi:hypothetical protein
MQRQRPTRRSRPRIIERDGVPVGVVIGGMQSSTQGVIDLVATQPAAARRGSGMAAAAIFEQELAGLGVTSIIVPAPAAYGIAVYFWIRLGYRPLDRARWPCDEPGVAWFARDL